MGNDALSPAPSLAEPAHPLPERGLAAQRDPFLDAVRVVAILRVVVVHLLGPTRWLWWPAPTWVMNGMPLVFFVSGALAAQSLRPQRRSTGWQQRFVKSRLRRLLIPYWGYLATVLIAVVLLDLVHPSDGFTVTAWRLLDPVIPVFQPRLSPHGNLVLGHLWFMSAFLVLTLAAPLLVRVHRTNRRLLAAGLFAAFLVIQSADVFFGVPMPTELDTLSLYACFYVAGFWYTDGSLAPDASGDRSRVIAPLRSPGAAAVLVAGLFIAARLYAAWDLSTVGTSEILGGLLGAMWLVVVLVARGPIVAIAARFAKPISRLSRRTLTIYLWGWPATRLSWMAVKSAGLDGWVRSYAFLVSTLCLLYLAVALFGRLEDVAAGRRETWRGRLVARGGRSTSQSSGL